MNKLSRRTSRPQYRERYGQPLGKDGVSVVLFAILCAIYKYNNAETFFFLDQPYENTNKDFGYAEDADFDFERLATLLRLIKGKFLMTINDSPDIRRLFKGFNIKPWKVKTPWQKRP